MKLIKNLLRMPCAGVYGSADNKQRMSGFASHPYVNKG